MKLNPQIILITIIPIILFSVIITIVVSVTISDQLIESDVQKMEILTQFTSSEMKNPMYNLDVDKLNEIIDTLELEDTVTQVLVLFPDGRVLTDGTDEDYNFGNILDDKFLDKSIISNGEQFLIKKEIVRISTPISLNEKIGILVIDFSLKPIKIIIQQTYLQISIISAILIGIFIFISIFFSRSITMPILKIKTRFEKISKGEYEDSEEKFGITEIQELSNAVNQMNKKLEMFQKEMIKNEKMAVVGELSARISHDLRNPLTIMKNAMDIIHIKNPEFMKENHKHFDMINSAMDKMTLEITRVLGYTKTKTINKSTSKFLDIVENMLISINLPKNINIIKPKNNHDIWCDSNQLENTLSNLVTNSIQSIGKNPGEVIINIENENEFDKITVYDNGPGIPKDSIEFIFEPLYTTKQYGTGLGLVNCKNTISSHGGKIFAENLQKGVMFTILLPKKQKENQ